ncbi:MAG: hypothetical protein Q4B28_01480 [bacterium]|nr:hypothetical protein [bacterium]
MKSILQYFWKQVLLFVLGSVFWMIGYVTTTPLYPTKKEAIVHAQQMLAQREVVLDTVSRAVVVPYRGEEYLVDAQTWSLYLQSRSSLWLAWGIGLILVALVSGFAKIALLLQQKNDRDEI